ncbi:MAG TPA: ABC transporter permease [Candidatus Angelobacter sp.]
MYWFRRLFRKQQTERQLDSELRFHLEQRAAELADAGVAPEDARRCARIEFGGMEGVKEECRESRRVHLIETLLQDVRYGVRMMRRSPGFTTVAIITLGLGIGANTAIFSVVNGVLLSPLPYPHPEQLVALDESKPNFQFGSISYPNFVDWRDQNHTFSAMAIVRGTGFGLTGAGDPEQVSGLLVSSQLFDMLGVKPVIGRTFKTGEDAIGAAPIVLIHAGLWQRKYGSSRDILGQSMTLDGKSYTIVGVIPVNFGLDQGLGKVDVYMPIGQWGNPFLKLRTAGLGIHGIGRLKPGVSVVEARADMERLTKSLTAAYPEEDKGIGASLLPLRDKIVGRVHVLLVVLLTAVGFVLLIACVNVANLLLARSTARTREFAVRIALGASKSRLVRQLLTESTLLALGGGALGLALAAWTQGVLVRTLPDALPRVKEIQLDVHVLIFTLLVSLFSGIVFGLAPALRTSRPAALAVGNRQSANRMSHRTQSAFVVVEIALSLVLLAGAGLMIRSLVRLWNTDPGFDAHNILTFGISLPPSMMKAPPPAIRAALRQLDDRIASIPGVQAVAPSWGAFPLQTDDEAVFWMQGQPKPKSPNDMNWALSYVVGNDYLKIMRTPLLRGRFFDASDDERSPHVAVVDEAFAAKFFPGQDPLGKLINLYDNSGNNGSPLVQIIGVVKHVKQWSLDKDGEELQPQMYRPFMQLPDAAITLTPSGIGMVVRSQGDPDALFDSIRRVMRRDNGEEVLYGPRSMEAMITQSLAARRYAMFLLGGFAALALMLAAIGIYGVVSYVVGRRTQEIGIRMALGARRVDVLRLVLRQSVWLIAMGVGAGLAAALALTQLMTSLVFGVSASDPLTYFCVTALLTGVALLACSVPARRAMRVDPMNALRCE